MKCRICKCQTEIYGNLNLGKVLTPDLGPQPIHVCPECYHKVIRNHTDLRDFSTVVRHYLNGSRKTNYPSVSQSPVRTHA